MSDPAPLPRRDVRTPELPINISSPSPSIHIFLSSTIRDLKDLREDLAKRLAKYQIRCFRSEEDRGAHQTVVDYCRWHLNDSDGYILLLGLWYGWIPPGCDRSITQLEYEWALERWPVTNPPMLVLDPTAGTPLWNDLKQRAQALATGAAANQLASSLGQALNLDIFEISTASESGRVGAEVTLGQQLGQNLFVKVQQGIGDLAALLCIFGQSRFVRLHDRRLFAIQSCRDFRECDIGRVPLNRRLEMGQQLQLAVGLGTQLAGPPLHEAG